MFVSYNLENLGRLKKLEYLNLALNNIEVIENLEGQYAEHTYSCLLVFHLGLCYGSSATCVYWKLV